MASETPLVHRTVRGGGLLLAVAAVQFAVVALVAVSRYPGYDWKSTKISSVLGASAPWGGLFAGSLVALGVLAVIALLLCWSAFDARRSRLGGLLLLEAGAVSAVAVGAAGLVGGVASVGRWAIDVGPLFVGVGLLVLPFAMHRQDRWRISRFYTFASGLVVVTAGALYLAGQGLSLGPGGLQTVGLGAALLWPIVEGAHIAFLHRFAPGLHVKVAAA